MTDVREITNNKEATHRFNVVHQQSVGYVHQTEERKAFTDLGERLQRCCLGDYNMIQCLTNEPIYKDRWQPTWLPKSSGM